VLAGSLTFSGLQARVAADWRDKHEPAAGDGHPHTLPTHQLVSALPVATSHAHVNRGGRVAARRERLGVVRRDKRGGVGALHEPRQLGVAGGQRRGAVEKAAGDGSFGGACAFVDGAGAGSKQTRTILVGGWVGETFLNTNIQQHLSLLSHT
jgi:hypothetical protein